MKTIFFIPARGGSTRVKNKNLKKIYRTSILVKKIKNCLATKLGKVYVSTDSKKIAQISTNNGANILGLRPKSLSTSKSSMLSSIINFLENYQKKYSSLPDFIILAPTTNPFLNKNSICQSIKVLKNKPLLNSIVSVYSSNDDPFQLVNFQNKKLKFNIFNYGKKNYLSFERSQDKPTFMKLSSALQITRAKYFKKYFKNKKLVNRDKPFDYKKCLGYVVNSMEAVDINIKEDFDIIKEMRGKTAVFKKILNNYC